MKGEILTFLVVCFATVLVVVVFPSRTSLFRPSLDDGEGSDLEGGFGGSGDGDSDTDLVLSSASHELFGEEFERAVEDLGPDFLDYLTEMASSPCTPTVDGEAYNLAAFKTNGKGWNVTTSTAVYQIAICETLTYTNCKVSGTASVAVCYIPMSGGKPTGKPTTLAIMATAWGPRANGTGPGVILSLPTAGNKVGTCSSATSVQVVFMCNPNVTQVPTFKYAGVNSACLYTFTVVTSKGCALGPPSPPPPPPASPPSPATPSPPPPPPPPTPSPHTPPSPPPPPPSTPPSPPTPHTPPPSPPPSSPPPSPPPSSPPPSPPPSSPPPSPPPPPPPPPSPPPPPPPPPSPPPPPPPPACGNQDSCVDCQALPGCGWDELINSCVLGLAPPFNCSKSCGRFAFCAPCTADISGTCGWQINPPACVANCETCVSDCSLLCAQATFDCTACQTSSPQCVWTPERSSLGLCSPYEGPPSTYAVCDNTDASPNQALIGKSITAGSILATTFFAVVGAALMYKASVSYSREAFTWLGYWVAAGTVLTAVMTLMAIVTTDWLLIHFSESQEVPESGVAYLGLHGFQYCADTREQSGTGACDTYPYSTGLGGALAVLGAYARTVLYFVLAGGLLDLTFLLIYIIMKTDRSGRSVRGTCRPRLLTTLALSRSICAVLAVAVWLVLAPKPHVDHEKATYGFSVFLAGMCAVIGVLVAYFSYSLSNDRGSDFFEYTSF